MSLDIDRVEWDFAAVPDDELVACCYWEYARESAFIRDVRHRCLDPRWKTMLNSELWEYCGNDIERIQSIGYPSEVIVRGFFCPPGGVLDDALPLRPGETHRLTGAFPKSWQTLTQPERDYRKHIGNDVERIPLVPFARGIALDAKDILDCVKARRARAEAERERVRRKNPNVNDEMLERLGKLKFPIIAPSIYWESGREMTVVAINWGSFTNDEIANHFRKWVKVNRPAGYEPPSRKGHKATDWRANLTRLAVMRLLARFTALDLVDPRRDKLPAIWKAKQFSRAKWRDVTKWHDARREAGQLFHKLFPFISPEDKPLSWGRQAPAK